MHTSDPHDVAALFLALGLLLTAARIGGELARKLGQPAVLGEIAAGVLLGPTVMGRLAPAAFATLFTGAGAVALSCLGQVAVVLFLLVAGMEVQLRTVRRQGGVAIAVSAAGILVPFGLGLSAAYLVPALLCRPPGGDPLIFGLFFATAMSISAMAVIAKTLMDIGLFRTDLGMTIMAAAIFEDFIGWAIFALILGLIGADARAMPVWATLGLTVAFALGMLTVGRRLLHPALLWLQAHASWPAGVLGAIFALAFFGAAFTAWVGVHAVFGAFIVGVALGDSRHIRAPTRATIDQVVASLLAPLFFGSIGLKVDFVAHFDVRTAACVLLLAVTGKVGGCTLAAMAAGMDRRHALALGFGMNARGSMEIILGSLGLGYGIIDARLFVALVVMTVATAAMSGPAMQRALAIRIAQPFTHHLPPEHFVARLAARDAAGAIAELGAVAAGRTGTDAATVVRAAQARERLMATGVGGGVAIPNARLEHLSQPVVAVGLSAEGIDFGGPDHMPAHLVLLVLTPALHAQVQLEIIADISATFSHRRLVEAARRTASFTEFLALARTREPPGTDA